ncbi:peptide chain release factor N(5)-glutamine methyltransferase [Brucella pituitosa]|uniref:Release factor glutamine methyltransferase n=1 Tax=Brucella pituitosa TaxID=571256 RepID=A0ABS3JTN7_9HYPH|nr:peptide chain release factor N(5)-glutamine methyltransferase [Brucella pituitosa]MBO1038044.1 peptide chain release factor N(5)-glutamine methyltransferase [Brucella pituitosa]
MASSRARLRAAEFDTPDLDAELLVEWITGATRLDLISSPEKLIDEVQLVQLNDALERRIAGEPVHRIIGMREFYGLPFRLSPETLEPRPDTEALVELVSPYLEKLIAQHGRATTLDMGTGTGAIVISLLHQFEKLHGVGLDVAEGALAMARINAAMNGVSDRFAALKSDWFANVRGRFHLIVSNPPYIPHEEIADLSREVREHDPMAALDGGADGLDFYRALAKHAAEYLYKDGIVAVEIGAGQFDDVSVIFESADFHLINSASDLGGHRRAMVFTQKDAMGF